MQSETEAGRLFVTMTAKELVSKDADERVTCRSETDKSSWSWKDVEDGGGKLLDFLCRRRKVSRVVSMRFRPAENDEMDADDVSSKKKVTRP